MKPSAEQSADLKQALKHDPVTPELRAEAERFPLEADEAFAEHESGADTATPGSWVDLLAVWRLGREEAYSSVGMTYDNDPSSPRSVAYDEGRNAGESV